jgi:glycine dehydrogenase subunit 2
MNAIAEEAERDPEAVRGAPTRAPIRRVDEATAARHPDLRWRAMAGAETPCPD